MIIFENDGELDLRGLRIHGLSAKEHSGARGQFGTGLKHAISVILRLGGQIKINSGMTSVNIFSEAGEFRGKEYHEVWAQPENESSFPLGFTTNLGKDWKPWMAYREIWSNCEDERGRTRTYDGSMNAIKLKPNITSVIVSCEEIERIHEAQDDVIIPDSAKPLWSSGDVDVHEGESEYVFYRGIRALKLKNKAAYRYNVKRFMNLTEDRTIGFSWMVDDLIRDAIISCPDKSFVVGAFSGKYESNIDYDDVAEIGEPFRQAAYDVGAPEKANRAALRIPDPEAPTSQVCRATSETLECAIVNLDIYFNMEGLRSKSYILGATGCEIRSDALDRVIIPENIIDNQTSLTRGLILYMARDLSGPMQVEQWLAGRMADFIVRKSNLRM